MEESIEALRSIIIKEDPELSKAIAQAVDALEKQIRTNDIIRHMADFISTFDIDEKICKDKQFADECGIAGRDCIECIIKHFE